MAQSLLNTVITIIIRPKKLIRYLRNIFNLFENISHLIAYTILFIINLSQYFLSRIIVSFDVFQGKWDKIKDYKKSKNVAIFGNGPSLKKISLKNFKENDVITCNFFIRHPEATDFKSTFHVVADGFVEDTSLDEILSHKSNAYLIHYSWKNFLNKPNKNFFYFVPSILTIARWRGLKLYNSFPLPAPLNSVQLALMLAILLNYNKIFLYGVDEDQLANRLIQENKHFYKEDKASAQGKNGVITATYIERIKSKYLSMVAYKNLQSIANANGIEIINKNPKSYVDCFKFE